MAEWNSQLPSNPLMVGVVSSIPTGGNFNFLLKFFKTSDVNFVQKCKKCQIRAENESLEQMSSQIHRALR